MRLEQTRYDNRKTGCCAGLDRERWDKRELVFERKPFVKGHSRSFMHIPLNLSSVMEREHAAVQRAGAYPSDPFWLVDELSPWGSDVYLATDRDVPGLDMTHLTGTFLSKVYEGSYSDVGTWIADMNDYAANLGKPVKKLYFYYATCPKCAKQLGKNEVVLLAQVE